MAEKDGVDEAAQDALREPDISLRVLTKEEAKLEDEIMTQEEVMEQVREKVFHILEENTDENYQLKVAMIGLTDQILSIPVGDKSIKELIEGWAKGKLQELDPDQSLPSRHFITSGLPKDEENCDFMIRGYKEAQETMLKEHWVKVLEEK